MMISGKNYAHSEHIWQNYQENEYALE